MALDSLKQVNWTKTLLHNLQRALAAGIIFALIFLFTGESASMAFAMVAVYPIMYLFGFLPVGLLFIAARKMGVPFAEALSALVSLFVAIGDPLVWILDKVKTEWVMAESPGFFNWTLVVLLIKEPVESLD